MLQRNTKIEQYQYKGINYFVKREDLACLPPGPPFAKVRGLYPYLKKLKQRGINIIGYMDTAISMAGWGISYFAKQLNMKAVLFYPQYKDGYRHNQKYYIHKWEKFGAVVIPLTKPNRQQININRARKIFEVNYTDGIWLPNGLRFQETLYEVEKEFCYSIEQIILPSSIVINVGSGVMLAGILRGLHTLQLKMEKIIGILAHNELNTEIKKRTILKMAGFNQNVFPLFFSNNLSDITNTFEIVSGNYEYHEKAIANAPFPCNPYYDLKAFEYLKKNIEYLPKPILFWNIGA